MSRDIRIPVQVTPEEYVAFKFMCDETGISMSGRCRQLIRSDISEHAQRDIDAHGAASAKEAQD